MIASSSYFHSMIMGNLKPYLLLPQLPWSRLFLSARVWPSISLVAALTVDIIRVSFIIKSIVLLRIVLVFKAFICLRVLIAQLRICFNYIPAKTFLAPYNKHKRLKIWTLITSEIDKMCVNLLTCFSWWLLWLISCRWLASQPAVLLSQRAICPGLHII